MKKLKKNLEELEKSQSSFQELILSKEILDIRPVCHYMMGGIAHRYSMGPQNSKVSGLQEKQPATVSHGSNRLGANSTSECIVWGKITGEIGS